MPTEPTPLAWLQSRLSDEEHVEFYKGSDGYEALVCSPEIDGEITVMARGDGPSLEEAVAALRRADAEQQGQNPQHEG